ncbi:hypothetical protein [Nonomuraea wenchangensis]|uniref:hypothetical protein n=1 Tax=Nonomuraea wenchangensis TaxID=568860 RepID=UPI003331CB32
MDLIILVMGDPFQPDPGNSPLRPIFKHARKILLRMARRTFAVFRRRDDAQPRIRPVLGNPDRTRSRT